MKKILTIAFIVISAIHHAYAQSPYTLSTSTVAYTALTGATIANGANIWANQYWPLPIPFTCTFGATTVNTLYTDGSVIYADTSGTSADIFQYVFAQTMDRGTGTTSTRSPLRYTTTGTAPNRIFKIENSSIGFVQEQATYHTLNDSFDCQLWVYETTNVVEMHFGNSNINHPLDYFGTNALPSFVGYGNANYTLGLLNFAWLVSGDPTHPYLDSFKNSPAVSAAPLFGWPVSGTVYRFSPAATTAIASVNEKIKATVYPTLCTGRLNISYADNAACNYNIISANGSNTCIAGELKQGTNTIDASALAAGMYLVQLQTSNTNTTYKFIKK